MTQDTFVLLETGEKVFAVGFEDSNQTISRISSDIKDAAQFSDWDEAFKYLQIYTRPSYEFQVSTYQGALDFITPKLYIVFLGGNLPPNRFGEDHEIVSVVANSQEEAKKLAKSYWSGYGKAHIDGIMEITTVDGYRVNLEKTTESNNVKLESNWSKLNG